MYICKDKPKTKSAFQKVKLLSLYLQNGKQLGYTAPVSSQENVNKMYNKIQKLNEQDQLSIMRQEVGKAKVKEPRTN